MSESEQVDLTEYLEELKEAKAKRLEEKGYKSFFKLEEGETPIKIEDLPFRKVKGDYGTRLVCRITNAGQEYDFAIPAPLEQSIVESYLKGQHTFTVIRVGQGQNTRYSLKK